MMILHRRTFLAGAALSADAREETPRPGPLVDIRVRWRAGQVALGLAALMTVAALFRPLSSAAC